MRILLRCKTGLFYKSDQEWTECPREAMDFRGTFRALECARAAGIREAEVILFFDDTAYNMSFPVPSVQGENRYSDGEGR